MPTISNLGSSSLIGLIKKFRSSNNFILSKAFIKEIEDLITHKRNQLYHYEVLALYQYVIDYRNISFFSRIDSLLFPPRAQPLIDVSFQLSYLRLIGLVRSRGPYKSWVGVVRELLHDQKVTSTDLKWLMQLNSMQSVKQQQQFEKLYEDYLSIFIEQIPKMESMTLFGMQKYILKGKMRKEIFDQIKQKIKYEVISKMDSWTNSQLKFIFSGRRFQSNVYFNYFLKHYYYTVKKYAFLNFLLVSRSDWASDIHNKFSRKEILKMMPGQIFNPQPFFVVERIFSQLVIKREFIDEFFDISVSQDRGLKVYRLPNSMNNYNSYILNAFYYLHNGFDSYQTQDFQKISQIMTKYKKCLTTQIYVYLYLSVKQIMTYYRNYHNNSKFKKLEQQKHLIKEIAQIITTQDLIKNERAIKSSFFPYKLLRILATFEFEIFQTNEFKTVYEHFSVMSEKIYEITKIGKDHHEYSELIQIIKIYMTQKRDGKNKISYGKMVKYTTSDNKFNVEYAFNPQINKIVSLDYLVHVINPANKKSFTFFVYIINFPPDEITFKIKATRYWIHHYVEKWCGFPIHIKNWGAQFETYLETEEFRQFVKDNSKILEE